LETMIKKAEMPLVKFHVERLGLVQLFNKYVPNSIGARCEYPTKPGLVHDGDEYRGFSNTLVPG